MWKQGCGGSSNWVSITFPATHLKALRLKRLCRYFIKVEWLTQGFRTFLLVVAVVQEGGLIKLYASGQDKRSWNKYLTFTYIMRVYFLYFCTSATSVDSAVFIFVLWQCCAYCLVRFRHKNHFVSGRKSSSFCLKYMENVKNVMLSRYLIKNILFCSHKDGWKTSVAVASDENEHFSGLTLLWLMFSHDLHLWS